MSDALRVRNLGLIEIRAGDIVDHEYNHRTHPVAQREAFGGTVDQIGWYGYPAVFMVQDGPDAGKYKLIDGELRKYHIIERYGPDQIIQVNLTDFTESEAGIALATCDPLSALAGVNKENLSVLTKRIEDGGGLNEKLAGLVAKLKEDNKIKDVPDVLPPGPEDFQQITTEPPAEHSCPQCGYKWMAQPSGKKKVGTRRTDARDGDKKQARDRVAHLVTVGVLPPANSVPCKDCGDLGGVLEHQYDHHLGYAAEHHESVEAVCSQCHKKREDARLENVA